MNWGRVTYRAMSSKIYRLIIIGICMAILIVACDRPKDGGLQPNRKAYLGSNRSPSTETDTHLSSAKCQKIQHQLGETCIPNNPQRIVATDEIALEMVLALGLKPIAAGEPTMVSSRSRHLAGKTDDVVSLGKSDQLSLERILQLDPDLILGSHFALENNYDRFSQIAPTVAFDYVHDAWKAAFQRVGEILSRSQQAQQQLESYQNRVEKLRKAMGDCEASRRHRLDQTEVSVVRFYADGSVEFRDSSSFPGSVLKDVGLPRPAVQQKGTNSDITYRSVSLERLDLLDGDVIFVALDAGAKESFTKFSQDPLWQKLEAVQSDRVFTVDSGYWIFGNVLAANAILDDLFQYLVDSASVPSPTPGNSA